MKTTKKLSLALATILLASAAFVSSCKKKSTDTPDNDTTAAIDHNTAEQTSNDAVNMAGQASENGSVSYRNGSPDESPLTNYCASYWKRDTLRKVDSVAFNGSLCADGKVRSGSLTFTYGANQNNVHYRTSGFTCTVKTYNYVVNGNQVSMTKTITNTSPTNYSTLTWSVTANVTIVKANSGGTITWTCNRTHTLLNATSAYTINGVSEPACYTNQSTPINWAGAVVSFNGSASGTTAKGENYSLTATTPLIVNMNCAPDATRPGHHPIVQGSFDFTPQGKGTRHVDFGNGTCDFDATVIVYALNGNHYGPFPITLK